MYKDFVWEELKEKIIDDYKKGGISQRQLAKKYNIGLHYIHKALGNKIKQTNEYHRNYYHKRRIQAQNEKEYIKTLESKIKRLESQIKALKQVLDSHE